jgi:hypothetical protein
MIARLRQELLEEESAARSLQQVAQGVWGRNSSVLVRRWRPLEAAFETSGAAGVKTKIADTETGVREAETQKARTDAKNAKLKLFLEASREEQGPASHCTQFPVLFVSDTRVLGCAVCPRQEDAGAGGIGPPAGATQADRGRPRAASAADQLSSVGALRQLCCFVFSFLPLLVGA